MILLLVLAVLAVALGGAVWRVSRPGRPRRPGRSGRLEPAGRLRHRMLAEVERDCARLRVKGVLDTAGYQRIMGHLAKESQRRRR